MKTSKLYLRKNTIILTFLFSLFQHSIADQHKTGAPDPAIYTMNNRCNASIEVVGVAEPDNANNGLIQLYIGIPKTVSFNKGAFPLVACVITSSNTIRWQESLVCPKGFSEVTIKWLDDGLIAYTCRGTRKTNNPNKLTGGDLK